MDYFFHNNHISFVSLLDIVFLPNPKQPIKLDIIFCKQLRMYYRCILIKTF
jgi:hypothetical protein